MYIFTYGTLQSNECRGMILPVYGCEFVGNAKIKGMKIYHSRVGNFPVIFSSDTEDEVVGEVYKVDDTAFVKSGLKHVLDKIEGTGVMYKVSNKRAELCDSKETIDVVVYEGINSFWGYGKNDFIKNYYSCVNVTRKGKWSLAKNK